MGDRKTRPEALDAVRRASMRAAAATYLELKRGLNSLASIAVTATFVGVLGTLFGILSLFTGISGDRAGLFPIYAGILSDALLPIALGLAIALVSFGGHQYLTARLTLSTLRWKLLLPNC